MADDEFDLIARIRQRAAARADVVLGIGDDAAVLALPADRQLVVTSDTLNAGVHFPEGTAADAVGWKALAVNLSDVAAMGARPRWCTLALSLPQADPAWLDGFLDGFLALAGLFDVALVGGDTTRGPLSIGVTALGSVAAGAALRRDGARPGDDIWLTGTVGDAAGALRRWQAGGSMPAHLQRRLERPQPRVATGRALAGIASACIDVSDGLLQDLGHVCNASGVGAQLWLDTLPTSEALRATFGGDTLQQLQCSGGDDYELCFTAAPAQRARIEALAGGEVPITRIGQVTDAAGRIVPLSGGSPRAVPARGYRHFG